MAGLNLTNGKYGDLIPKVFTPSRFIAALVILETIFCWLIIKKVPYTEIDWIAYMQEVGGFLGGERNYSKLSGDTGPLVYPAGFVYIFAVLYHITDKGINILRGQQVFAILYLLNLISVSALYLSSERKLPIYILFFLSLSKRIHSIFVLRMFNDCVAVFFGYLALNCFIKRKWRFGCLLYSLGVSVKMNMLLYAPGVLLVLLMGTGWVETIVCLSICACVQIVLGLPFLLTYPVEYLSRSFDLGRVFMYKWTVNLKFLPEDIFVGKPLSLALLALTALGVILFARKWVIENKAALKGREHARERRLIGLGNLDSHFIITTVFTSNFIGIAFARTLHYQFYVWYFHTLPFLLWHTQLPTMIRVLVMIAIEVAFNVYPATYWSSLLLQAAHITLLISLYLSPAPLAQQRAVVANNKDEDEIRKKDGSIRKWDDPTSVADKSD